MSSLNCLQMRLRLTFTTAFTAQSLWYRLACPAIKSQGCGWGPSCLCVLGSTLLQALCRVKMHNPRPVSPPTPCRPPAAPLGVYSAAPSPLGQVSPLFRAGCTAGHSWQLLGFPSSHSTSCLPPVLAGVEDFFQGLLITTPLSSGCWCWRGTVYERVHVCVSLFLFRKPPVRVGEGLLCTPDPECQ